VASANNTVEHGTDVLGLLKTLTRARLIAPLRPGRYVRMVTAVHREGMSATTGFAIAAARCPDRPGLIDEIGTLTWRELDDRANALAAAFQGLPSDPSVIGIMCRNHRGFVSAFVAANKIGADVLLLNTSFAGPALAEVVRREGVDVVVYDDEFSEPVEALTALRRWRRHRNPHRSRTAPALRTP
jgi:acyl-CoA synthetase (AMP-forming)/AMP-acid ligase II